jgi:hypothetical protein
MSSIPSLPTDKFTVWHGKDSPTFTAPALDGSITMPQMRVHPFSF